MTEMRGIVKKVVFSIEYPDGTTKDSTFTPSSRLNAVLLSEDLMNDKMKQMFTVSKSEWQKNPAMVIQDGDTLIPNCDYPQCQNA